MYTNCKSTLSWRCDGMTNIYRIQLRGYECYLCIFFVHYGFLYEMLHIVYGLWGCKRIMLYILFDPICNNIYITNTWQRTSRLEIVVTSSLTCPCSVLYINASGLIIQFHVRWSWQVAKLLILIQCVDTTTSGLAVKSLFSLE